MAKRTANTSNLEELRAVARSAAEEISRIETAEKLEKAKQLLGKCFKYRNNYSCPEKASDYWWLYLRVIGIDEWGDPVCFEFQTDKYGDLFIRPKRHQYIHMSGYMPIRLSEFKRAWESFTNHVWNFEPEKLPFTGGSR